MMTLNHEEESEIRSYLLGELAQEAAQRIEERIVRDDDFVEQVQLIEDELVEDYARGSLGAREREGFERHFLSTPRRRRKLAMVKGLMKYAAGGELGATAVVSKTRPPSRFRSLFAPQWKFAVVALLILAAGLGAWRVLLRRSPADEAMAALDKAYSARRPLEARITGLTYAPFSVTRGGEPEAVDYRARDLSEALLLGAASDDPSPATLHALGRVYLAKKEFGKAVLQFREALASRPDDAQLQADLGAALLEQGKLLLDGDEGGKGMELLAESLKHLNAALARRPGLHEALFNKALSLQSMNLPEQAKEAWLEYLSLDPGSKWADEARSHVKALSERSAAPPDARRLLDDFLAAARARDDERARRLMSRNREMISGKYIPQQLAITFLKKHAEGSEREAAELLDALAYAGRLDSESAGDPYVSDVAAYYARTSAGQRQLLGEAQTAALAGYALCVQSRFKEALTQFSRAKELFERAGNEWESRLFDYWVGYCHSQEDRIGESTDVLKSLVNYAQPRNYKWLLGHANCWIATNYAELGDHSKSIGYYNRALPVTEEIDDAYNTQKVLSQLGSQYNHLGQPQRALGYNLRSLRLADASHPGARQLWRNYLYTARTFINLGLYDAAAAYANEMLRVARDDIKAADVIHYSYHYLGQIYGGLRRYDEAIRLTSESIGIAKSLSGENAARKQTTYSLLQLAHLQRQSGRCDQALGHYEQAVQTFGQMELGIYRYDALKGRLLCHVALRNDAEIEAGLPVVLEQFNRYRATIREEQDRNSFFDREQGVYDIAVDHAHRKGDERLALAYIEDSRARSLLGTLRGGAEASEPAGHDHAPAAQPLGLQEIQARLPSDVQVLQYAVLEDKVLIWLITGGAVRSAKSEITTAELSAKIATYVSGISSAPAARREDSDRQAKELYDALVGPIAAHIDPRKIVCIIPDKAVARLPFSTLVSPQSGRYLISELTIQYAPSLNVFIHCSDAARAKTRAGDEALLSVGDPFFDAKDYPSLARLPAAAREARGIAKYYSPAHEFVGAEAVREKIEPELPNAEVIHFAGHYVTDDRDPLSSRLVLAHRRGAAEPDDDGSYAARDLVGRKLPRAKLVVLSACQTGAGKYYNGEGVVGISRTFLGTGIPLVVASQWAVDSEATAELMLRFHRYRKVEGLTAVAALRRAQLELLGDADGPYRSPYYWAAFLPIGGRADF